MHHLHIPINSCTEYSSIISQKQTLISIFLYSPDVTRRSHAKHFCVSVPQFIIASALFFILLLALYIAKCKRKSGQR